MSLKTKLLMPAIQIRKHSSQIETLFGVTNHSDLRLPAVQSDISVRHVAAAELDAIRKVIVVIPH